MAKFDFESFRDTLKGYLVDNMAAKVAEINTEKGDDPVLVGIPEAQYFQDFNGNILNFESFVNYGFMPFEAGDINAGDIGVPITLFFEIVVMDQDGGIVGENKSLRYTRAMLEIFAEQSTTNANISDLEITPFAPVPVQLANNADWYKVGRVEVKGILVL